MLAIMFRQLLAFLHFSGVIVWVGGMFFAYFCLRPAAAQLLAPPQRLPLWAATLNRFLRFVAYAVVLIVVTGFAMLLQTGFKQAPPGWHIMMLLGLLMAGIFTYIYAVLYPRLRRDCDGGVWPAAGATMNSIRHLVAVNLVLAVCTLAAAFFAQ